LKVGNRWVVTGGLDGTVRIYLQKDSQPHQVVYLYDFWKNMGGEVLNAARTLDLSEDESLVAAGADDGKVWLFNLPKGEVLDTIHAHDDRVTSIAFHDNGNLLATGSRNREVKLWQKVGSQYHFLMNLNPVGAKPVRQLAFTKDGRLLVLYDQETAIRSWNLPELRRVLENVGLGW
jgi:WD40 repeat protein